MNDAVSPFRRCRAFLFEATQPGQEILDVGCGDGDLLRELTDRGCHVRGVEISPSLVDACREQGLDVVHGFAESLPFGDATFDGIVCSVVLPYTDERRSIAEFSRVLKPGGFITVTSHGLGYALELLLRRKGLRVRFYGFRMIMNTLYYRATGHRLPGIWKDTICQSPKQMNLYFRKYGLRMEKEERIAYCFGQPRFLAQRARKIVN